MKRTRGGLLAKYATIKSVCCIFKIKKVSIEEFNANIPLFIYIYIVMRFKGFEMVSTNHLLKLHNFIELVYLLIFWFIYVSPKN